MELRPIEQVKAWYDSELCEAFPPNERKPLSAIQALMGQGRYQLWGLYEGKDLLGYATLWLEPSAPSCLLLDYLGVTATLRNRGLGGEILRLLAERCAGRACILAEAECPVDGAEEAENALRLRRLAFYERCGFRPAYEMATCGMRFRTLIAGPFPSDLSKTMQTHKAIYGHDRIDVVIPLPPGESPPPSLFI